MKVTTLNSAQLKDLQERIKVATSSKRWHPPELKEPIAVARARKMVIAFDKKRNHYENRHSERVMKEAQACKTAILFKSPDVALRMVGKFERSK